MRTLRVLALCIGVAATFGSHADSFSWQLTGGARQSELGTGADADDAELSVAYYLRPVDDADGPYALAPFLRRSGWLGARYAESKTTTPAATYYAVGSPALSSPATVTRAAGRSISGRYVWQSTGWYVGAAAGESDAMLPSGATASVNALRDGQRNRSLAFGKYVAEATTIDLSVGDAESDFRSELIVPCTGFLCALEPPAAIRSLTLETDLRVTELGARHVGRIGAWRYSLSGGVSSAEVETSSNVVAVTVTPQPALTPAVVLNPATIAGGRVVTADLTQRSERYALSGELFPRAALGVRIGYARWDGENALDESYELGASWFFARKVGAEVVLSRTKSGLAFDAPSDSDTVSLRIVGRL